MYVLPCLFCSIDFLTALKSHLGQPADKSTPTEPALPHLQLLGVTPDMVKYDEEAADIHNEPGDEPAVSVEQLASVPRYLQHRAAAAMP